MGIKTNWPTRTVCREKTHRHQHTRIRKGRGLSKAEKAARREELDVRQLAERYEYAGKVFAWARHEHDSQAEERAIFLAEPPPVTVEHPECIEPVSNHAVDGAHTLRTLRDKPRVTPARTQAVPADKFGLRAQPRRIYVK